MDRATDTNWFGDHWHAMFAIMVSEIWKTTPFMALLLLAGLSQVCEDMLEAAQVDGATWWQRLWKVILPEHAGRDHGRGPLPGPRRLPHLRQHLHHDQGRPGHRVVSFLTYRQVIEQMQLGLGSALSVLLFLSVLLLAWLIVKLFKVDLAPARGEG